MSFLSISRRVLMLGTAALAVFRAYGATTRPNILLLLSDDHSVPFLECYGTKGVKTPTLDALAAEGLLFSRFFTSAPQCVPSRATLMTGRSPVAARMTRFEATLPRSETVFPEWLRQAGYYTGVCGRLYHLDGGARSNPLVATGAIERLGLRTFPDRMDFVETGDQTKTDERFGAFLDQVPAGRPFFFWLNYSDPHHPWTADTFRPDPNAIDVPPWLPDIPSVRDALAAHIGEINRVDTLVRRALEVLEQRHLAENTIVIFAGDNGMAFPHGKGSLHDPGLNTPLIVRWPGVVQPGRKTAELISGEDLAPTLLAAAGLPVPPTISGVSFLPLLRGESHQPRRYVFGERGMHGAPRFTPEVTSNGVDLARCVRSDRYKLIYNFTIGIPYAPVDSQGDRYWQDMSAAWKAGKLARPLADAYFRIPRPIYEFYDLEKDPAEMHNLFGQADYAGPIREHLAALWDKMVLDWDYLPLPDLKAGQGPATAGVK